MNDASFKLNREMQAAEQIKAHLAAVTGDDNDAELIRDMIEGETNLDTAIEIAIMQTANDNALIEGLKIVIAKMTARQSRIKKRIEMTRTIIQAAMETAQKDTFETAVCRITLKNVPDKAIFIDEALIPSDYWKPQDPTLDKKAVLAALKVKMDVPGAQLSNGGKTTSWKWT
ncbi:MAG: hypothetical protein GY807_21195 [Gammaproteobacteria bacterium]|nr:hypothetical protein [Gammaproteobacteria bacterium]